MTDRNLPEFVCFRQGYVDERFRIFECDESGNISDETPLYDSWDAVASIFWLIDRRYVKHKQIEFASDYVFRRVK